MHTSHGTPDVHTTHTERDSGSWLDPFWTQLWLLDRSVRSSVKLDFCSAQLGTHKQLHTSRTPTRTPTNIHLHRPIIATPTLTHLHSSTHDTPDSHITHMKGLLSFLSSQLWLGHLLARLWLSALPFLISVKLDSFSAQHSTQHRPAHTYTHNYNPIPTPTRYHAHTL